MLPAVVAFAAGGQPAAASSDTVVVRDKYPIVRGQALDGTIVYERSVPRRLRSHRSSWMRVIDGRRLPVRGGGWIGRDHAGRIVLPFQTTALTPDGVPVNRWWLYDVATGRVQRLHVLRSGTCTATNVAVWRTRLAYQAYCRNWRRSGVYLREGRRTRRVSRMSAEQMPLLLRGRTLMMGTGGTDEGDSSLWRLAAGGHVCPALIPPAGAPADHNFTLFGAWLTGRRVSWWMESSLEAIAVPPGGNLILGTRLGRGCAPPAPTGSYAPVYGRPIAVDGSALYYAVGRTLYRRDISAGPSTAPPPNDDFAHAQEISGALPLTIGARIGYGTRWATDPAIPGPSEKASPTATRTLWYSYRPTESGQVQYIVVDQWEWLGGDLPDGAFAVYQDGPGGRLTELPHVERGDGNFVAFRSDPAHRYWIGLGCATTAACFPSFTITITTEPPYWPPDPLP